jgi:hypothetical protein
MTVPVTPDQTEPANDVWTMRAAAIWLGLVTILLAVCATWLTAVDKPADVVWTLAGTGLGALAMLATTRRGVRTE